MVFEFRVFNFTRHLQFQYKTNIQIFNKPYFDTEILGNT